MTPQPGQQDGQDMFQPPMQQDQGGIDIPVTACSTRAGMPSLIKPFCVDRPTRVTALRRFEVPCGSLSIDDTSFYRFVPQHAEKLCWRTIQNRLVQSCLRGCPIGLILPCGGILLGLRTFRHVRDVQRFREHGTRSTHHLYRLFMMKVQALPGDLGMQTCDTSVRDAPAMRELLFGITSAIRLCERRLTATQEAWIL